MGCLEEEHQNNVVDRIFHFTIHKWYPGVGNLQYIHLPLHCDKDDDRDSNDYDGNSFVHMSLCSILLVLSFTRPPLRRASLPYHLFITYEGIPFSVFPKDTNFSPRYPLC